MRRSGLIGSAIVLALFCAEAQAHSLTRQECTEGSDFIKNAALSRDNGLDGTTFISNTQADFEVIKSFPAALRWFVQDKQDEDYLLAAIVEVFQNPLQPGEHQQRFFAQCLTRGPLPPSL